jgi:hypothetical protein
MRQFSPDDYKSRNPPLVDAQAWTGLTAGRALLMVHGTMSQAHSGFGAFSPEVVRDLHRIYCGRVFAFDHPTLSEDPTQNVKKFVEMIPEGAKLELDVVCHSRGGLVSRVLVEKQGALGLGSRSVSVRRVVFVATPNAGTVLSDFKYLGSLVDRYTTLLNFFPTDGLLDVLEAIIVVVKQMAVAVGSRLPGLTSMVPGGPYLRSLNSSVDKGSAEYYAIASNFEPPEGALREFIRDQVVDRIFGAENDLIVPTSGVYSSGANGDFSIANPFVFDASASVQHSGFFENAAACDQMKAWLSA